MPDFGIDTSASEILLDFFLKITAFLSGFVIRMDNENPFRSSAGCLKIGCKEGGQNRQDQGDMKFLNDDNYLLVITKILKNSYVLGKLCTIVGKTCNPHCVT